MKAITPAIILATIMISAAPGVAQEISLQTQSCSITITISAAPGVAHEIAKQTQNGFGRRPLPPPSPILPDQPAGAQALATCLGMPGYNFVVDESTGQQPSVIIDSQKAAPKTQPGISAQGGPGFCASFQISNNSNFDHVFQFVDQYNANIKIEFTVSDGNGNVVWLSYATKQRHNTKRRPPEVNLKLAAHSTWQKTVFVPLQNADLTPLDPGLYTLTAHVIGTPSYSATAPFLVGVPVSGGFPMPTTPLPAPIGTPPVKPPTIY